MAANSFQDLRLHVGHQIVCVRYQEESCALECEDCKAVLLSFAENELPGHDETTIQDGEKFFFNIQIAAEGKTAKEAWEYAVETFCQDPGDPPEPVKK